jgi:hypothetical protein
VADWATAISCQLRTGPSSPWWSTVLQGPQFCATHWVAQALRLAHTLLRVNPVKPGTSLRFATTPASVPASFPQKARMRGHQEGVERHQFSRRQA